MCDVMGGLLCVTDNNAMHHYVYVCTVYVTIHYNNVC